MPIAEEKTSGGITYLERPGTGPVVVFLHGIGSNASSFLALFQHLPPDARLIAWNAPGYGGSAPLARTWPEAQDYAAALSGLFDRLQLSDVTLVGHSLGTLIGAAFAARHPDRLARLVLASCAVGYRVPPGGTLPGNVGRRIEELELQGPDAFAAERAPRLVFEPRLNLDIVAQVERAMSQVERGGYAQAVRMLASGDLLALMAQVHLETTFIIGINDRVTPEQQTLDAALAWGKANGKSPGITRINQAGHAVYLQKPQDFAAALALAESAGTAEGSSARHGAKGGEA
ncbi:alpha/beta fold hydrolase [Oceanibium sediminis]|uniref:alpha/beta fold hydrolase n=1 Tax=Oceanibium sediminis TaxID=2026339 RepID=UPI000DD4943C|nr:alpha/beta hydrolase [Oceanibium sediminis]